MINSLQNFGRTTGRRWQYNTKMCLKELGREVVDWINLDQDEPMAGSCECGNASYSVIKGGEFLDWFRLLASQERLCHMELIYL